MKVSLPKTMDYSWFEYLSFPDHHWEDRLADPERYQELLDNVYSGADQSQLEGASDMQLQLAKQEAEKLGGDHSRVLLGGYQQGTQVALASLFRQNGEKPLGGVLALNAPNIYKKVTSAVDSSIIDKVRNTPLYVYFDKHDFFYPPRVADFMFQQVEKYYQKPDGSIDSNFHFAGIAGPRACLSSAYTEVEWQKVKDWLVDVTSIKRDKT